MYVLSARWSSNRAPRICSTLVTREFIAFAATDVEGMRQRLQSKGVKFRESIVPRTGDTQFFLYDPDGVGVELNFPRT